MRCPFKFKLIWTGSCHLHTESSYLLQLFEEMFGFSQYIHTHTYVNNFFFKIQINTTVFCALLSIQGRSRVNTHFPCPAADILLSTLEARISGCIKGDRGSRGGREYLASSLENISGPKDSGEVRLSVSMLSKKMLDLCPMKLTAHWLDSVPKIYKAHKHSKTVWTKTPWIFGPKKLTLLKFRDLSKRKCKLIFSLLVIKIFDILVLKAIK